MRKHVTPALAGAAIPDPAHGRDLLPEGGEVEWSAYWAGLAERGDVTVREIVSDPDAGPSVPAKKKS